MRDAQIIELASIRPVNTPIPLPRSDLRMSPAYVDLNRLQDLAERAAAVYKGPELSAGYIQEILAIVRSNVRNATASVDSRSGRVTLFTYDDFGRYEMSFFVQKLWLRGTK